MAFLPAGTAQTLNVTSTSSTISLASQPQCRVWNRGPNPCRIRYSNSGVAATSMDVAIPNGFVEIHTRNNQDWLSAITATGESAVLEIISGSGD